MPLTIGQVLNNRYRIDALLGRGGMGAVYRAADLRLNTAVALKENLGADPAAQRQFLHEAGILAHLNHPNLPRVTDHFVVPGQGQYLVMDYVQGDDLAEILRRRGQIPEPLALAWIRQILDALEYLHGQNPPVIHRDVKLANIRITPGRQAMLVDFGLAKVLAPHLQTTAGARAVTPGFSPPEQYGQGGTDARSDLYAVGATLYALLTGQAPPEATDRVAGLATLVPPGQYNPAISPGVEAAILRALELRAPDRFQTADEFRRALAAPQAVGPFVTTRTAARRLGAAGAAAPPGAPYNQPSPVPYPAPGPVPPAGARRPAWFWWAAGGVLLALVVILFGAGLRYALRSGSEHGGLAGVPTTAVPSLTPSPTLTLTPSPTPSITPSPTPTLTPSPSPTPSPTPSPVSPLPASSYQIAFASDRTGDTDLYLMSWDGDQVKRLTYDGAGKGWPSWSPDRGTIVYELEEGESTALMLVDVATGATSRLLDSPRNPIRPAWSPDGSRIVFSSKEDGDWDLYLLDLASFSVQQVTWDGAWDSMAAWSRDGTQLVFTSDRTGNYDLFLLDLAAGAETRLTTRTNSDANGSWSPVSDDFAYTMAVGSGASKTLQIGVLNLSDPAHSRQLTRSAAIVQYPDYSPDGQWLVFACKVGSTFDVCRMPAGGGTITNLTNSARSNDVAPAWSR